MKAKKTADDPSAVFFLSFLFRQLAPELQQTEAQSRTVGGEDLKALLSDILFQLLRAFETQAERREDDAPPVAALPFAEDDAQRVVASRGQRNAPVGPRRIILARERNRDLPAPCRGRGRALQLRQRTREQLRGLRLAFDPFETRREKSSTASRTRSLSACSSALSSTARTCRRISEALIRSLCSCAHSAAQSVRHSAHSSASSQALK